MKSLKLVSPKTFELVNESEPSLPGKEEVLIRVKAVGICGSDLHMYETGAIGYTKIEGPFTLGHEFMGEVLRIGENAVSGSKEKLMIGQRVAVEPAVPCLDCELCEAGHPNLCPYHNFYGVYPTQGALCEQLLVPSRNCFPIPDEISDGGGTLLETLGVAIHAVDLAKLKIAKSVAVIGCGPVGLLIARLAVLSGAGPVYAFDPLEWRVKLAREWGVKKGFNLSSRDGVAALNSETNGRGVDVVFEAAWANESVDHAMEMAVHGGRVILVGIPPDDRTGFQHSTARRKGLTIKMVRRMKHTYPRAIKLASGKIPQVPLDELISETVPLVGVADAFARNASYQAEILKIVARP
jgi:L-iditol 2-dehydrogenase